MSIFIDFGNWGFSVATNVASKDILLDTNGLIKKISLLILFL